MEPVVLLIEDDQRLAELTTAYLAKHGVQAIRAANGKDGLELALKRGFDVVLLDLMLPDMDGLELCRQLRTRSSVPVIMLTARGEEADRVMGLELGADDYLPKPFAPRELLARIRAQTRRARGLVGPSLETLTAGELLLDPGRRCASCKGETLELTSYEFDILYALARNSGRVLGRERLMELAKGDCEEAFDRSIDVHVSRLRKKLGDDPVQPRYIRTVRGVGYQFVAGATDAG
ncbi:MAG: response regulator transcription factor [Myxococcota bacterium]|jgi:DNA-binding response OmpR family regulator|nr:response regulator transcription factor [Myxococcota bacterium]